MDSLFFRSIADAARKAARILGCIHAPRRAIGVFYERGADHFVLGLIDLPGGATKWVTAVEKNGIITGHDFCETLEGFFPQGAYKSEFVFLNERTNDPSKRRWILWEPSTMKPRLICGHEIIHEYTWTRAVN